MSCWKALAKLAMENKPEDARGNPRFVASALICDHGEVMDFSHSGLRIRFKRSAKLAEGDTALLTLQSPAGEHRCRVEVVWVKKLGFRKSEVGVRFADADAASKMNLFKSAFDPLAGSAWNAA